MLSDKSHVVTGSIDGQRTGYSINNVEKEECLEKVKELKSKG